MKSIQTKFLTIIISAMLILTVAISVTSLVYMGRMLEKDSDIITESVTNTETLKINSVLREMEYTAHTMRNYVYSSVNDVSLLYDESYYKQYVQTAKETFLAVAGPIEEISAFYLRFTPEIGGGASGFFMSKVLGNSNFYETAPTDLTNWQSAKYEDVCWFIEAQNNQMGAWLDPYVKSSSNVEIITYVLPLYDIYDNRFIGVVGIDVKFSDITDMVSTISVYDNGFAYLSEKDEGKIIFSPVDDHKLAEAHTKHGFAEEHQELINGMKLVIHADYSDIQRDSYRMITVIVTIALVLLTTFIIITYVLTKRIVKPLKNLTSAAEMLADGNTELELVDCKTKDEVGVLADAFEKTAEKLHSYMGYINALAYKDTLTGIKNRTAYNEMTSENDVKIKIGEIEPFGIFVADINNLKETNDKFGHEVGNKLIIKVAKVICDVFKRSPVYRIGGDEIAVLLRGADLENYEELLKELDAKFEESFIEVGNEKISVSVARGVATYNAEHDNCFEDVFEHADKKMYEHKRTARHREN